MPWVYTARHRHHDPQVELDTSALASPREVPARIDAIAAALLADEGRTFGAEAQAPTDHGLAPITAVHDPDLVTFLADAWQRYQREVRPVREVVPDVFAMAGLRRGMPATAPPAAVAAQLGWWCFETTTPLVAGTYDAARAAVDVALTAADEVLGGNPLAYAAGRPPGHHATRSLYGGYCFFNNAAVAAAYAAALTDGPVSVLDVDYHHGNGTQEVFYERGDVQVVSLHGDPRRAYPFHTGFADEVGGGRGRGTNHNYPLPAGLTDEGYLQALGEALAAIDRFAPGLIVLSLGVDTAATDPLGDLGLTTAGFHAMGALIAQCGLPLIVVQEGGYDLSRIGADTAAVLRGLRGAAETAHTPEPSAGPPPLG